MNKEKVKALLMDKELGGLHNVRTPPEKNQVELCWATAP